jgi:hypothetical protein
MQNKLWMNPQEYNYTENLTFMLVRANMAKLLMIMQHITICTPCIAFMLVSHTCIFTIDHMEQGHEEPPEAAPIEDANPK